MFQPQFIDNSVMRGRVHAISTLKGLVADLRLSLIILLELVLFFLPE